MHETAVRDGGQVLLFCCWATAGKRNAPPSEQWKWLHDPVSSPYNVTKARGHAVEIILSGLENNDDEWSKVLHFNSRWAKFRLSKRLQPLSPEKNQIS